MSPFDDDKPFDPDDEANLGENNPGGKKAGESGKGLWPDGLRKAIASGANVLFSSSDEGGKRPLGELKLPKEAMQFIYQQAERGRKDMFRVATKEMRRVLGTMDMRGELRRALVGVKVKVKAEISFEEADVTSSVKADVAQAQPPSADQTPSDGLKKARRRPKL